VFQRPHYLLLFIIITTINTYSQKDTIYLADTIINSVRILNKDNQELNYYYLDSVDKKTKTLFIGDIIGLAYENKKIEVFCDLVSRKKFLSFEEEITINYGNRDNLWLDKEIYTILLKDIKNYNSIIDALNYMGNEGWRIINSYSTSKDSYTIEHYILKKEITK
tara:strand:- start:465 stop:956 length:492 start_codon:yes stop_codon:yes gene_type:complete